MTVKEKGSFCSWKFQVKDSCFQTWDVMTVLTVLQDWFVTLTWYIFDLYNWHICMSGLIFFFLLLFFFCFLINENVCQEKTQNDPSKAEKIMLFQIGLKGFSGFHNIRHDLVRIYSLIHYFDFYFQHMFIFFILIKQPLYQEMRISVIKYLNLLSSKTVCYSNKEG